MNTVLIIPTGIGAEKGSYIVKGFMNPEGIIIYHKASGQLFKKTVIDDEKPKENNKNG